MGEVVKRSYKCRFPSPEQSEQLNRTFGCVRLVYSRAPATGRHRQRAT
ncbi:helix-turn-helix domain-containing protein [Micromonospora sp. CB01531]